jgi:hypothetical protein
MNRPALLRCDRCNSFGALEVKKARTLADAEVFTTECRHCGPASFRVIGARGTQARELSVLAGVSQQQEVQSA